MYIIATLGFAFIFNMMGVLNFAHGAVYMTSAFVCYYLSLWFGINNWLSLLLTIVVMGLLGILVERVAFTPFAASLPRLIMIAVAIITVMTTTTTVAAGTRNLIIDSFAHGTSSILGLLVSNERLLIAGIGFVLLAAVLIVVNKTTIGKQMQAIAQDRVGAALQGIRITRVSAIVCAVGFALAAIAGSMMGSLQKISPTMGDQLLVRILMIVMLAGVGSMNGLIITGFILGIIDSFLPFYIPGSAASAVSAVAVLVLLLLKPKGFFGHEM